MVPWAVPMRCTSQTTEEFDVPLAESRVGIALLMIGFIICAGICSSMLSLAVMS